jgi:hypothetical protein
MLREYREARRELKMERKREKLAFKRGALEEERVRREKRGEERGKACGRRERDVMVQLPSEPMMQSREARVEVEGAPPSYERAMKDTAGVKAGGESMRGEVYPAGKSTPSSTQPGTNIISVPPSSGSGPDKQHLERSIHRPTNSPRKHTGRSPAMPNPLLVSGRT